MKVVHNLLIVGLVVAGGVIALPEITAGQTGEFASLVDRFSPLVAKEPVYVLTNAQGTEKEHGTYEYTQLASTKEGDSYDLSFTAGSKLKKQCYLKLNAKGRFVEAYEEVPADQVPQEAKAELTAPSAESAK